MQFDMQNDFTPIIYPTSDHAQAYLICGIGRCEPVNSYFKLVETRYTAPTLNVAGYFCVSYYSDLDIDKAATVISFDFAVVCTDLSQHVKVEPDLCQN